MVDGSSTAADGARRRPDQPGQGVASDELQFLGRSTTFLAALECIRRLAPSRATVLIRGETGTGKELAARAIHYASPRRGGPFVPVNCGAIPEALVESELFGHVRGAFTDARERRAGLIAQARGGTLFLDEIEALSLRGQVALLRFLQDQEYRPVGGALVHDADVRVVGATNAELGELAARGAYRQDLLFRLDVLVIDLPPLRERGDDVVLLAEAFLQRLCRRYARPAMRLHPDAIGRLRQHAWPGNVRELENILHRELLLSDGFELRLHSLAPAPGGAVAQCNPSHGPALTGRNFREAKAQAVDAFERAYIAELLTRTHGNVSLAARLAGKERSRLAKLLRKHGISSAAFRAPASDAAR
jgi:DNA-binding NtrC family response regulator